MRIAFDIGGVLSKYPREFKEIMLSLMHLLGVGFWTGVSRPHHELFIITDMHNKEDVKKQLDDNGFGFINEYNIHCADYDTHGELCKAVLLRDLKIDMFFDDFIGYTMWPPHFGPAPIRCLIMPDGYKPYWAPEWKCSGGDFGRRVYKGGEGK